MASSLPIIPSDTIQEKIPSPPPISHQDSELTIANEKESLPYDIEQPPEYDQDQPELVDGPPYGWVIVFASFFSQFVSMSICNVYGVFNNHYLAHTFKDRASTFELAWVGTLAIVALDLAGPLAGPIIEHIGHRQASLTGVFVMALSLVGAAFSTEVWHLYLTQGVLYGLGGSLTYFASLTLPSQWFLKKNRGLATGISISGGGVGGLIMSPLVSKMLISIGLRWTLLALAIAVVVLLVPTSLLFKTRVESGVKRARRIKQFGYRKGESAEDEKKRKFIDFTILKDIRFCLLLVAGVFIVSGYFSPFYFINTYALQHGATAAQASLMVGLMNGFSAVGRIGMGFIGDRIGPMNALFISTLTASLTILLIWTFAKTVAVMFVFSVLYGLCVGAYLSSTVSVAAAICGLGRLATVTGLMYAGMAVGSMIGSPVSGAILDTIGHKTDYLGVILWCGLVMGVGAIVLLAMKYVTNKNLFARV